MGGNISTTHTRVPRTPSMSSVGAMLMPMPITATCTCMAPSGASRPNHHLCTVDRTYLYLEGRLRGVGCVPSPYPSRFSRCSDIINSSGSSTTTTRGYRRRLRGRSSLVGTTAAATVFRCFRQEVGAQSGLDRGRRGVLSGYLLLVGMHLRRTDERTNK